MIETMYFLFGFVLGIIVTGLFFIMMVMPDRHELERLLKETEARTRQAEKKAHDSNR
jgi:uncharacterized membrane protein YciS (DUF1049 family)